MIIRDNQIYGIKISNSGYGYLNEPTITLEGGTFNILNTYFCDRIICIYPFNFILICVSTCKTSLRYYNLLNTC